MSVIETASRVLRDEAAAVESLVNKLDGQFEKAVRMIDKSKGRVVLTGMGKSGHIARKVAATMASTGTPAFFLHPAEGIHGDLGMVTSEDVVIAYSNSGETMEILNILPSLKRIGPKLIAVVGKTNSTLAKNADAVLDAGVEKEADSLGLAPTSSTTAALALGDALAVCLMENRHFTADKFAIFHPGGSLGKKLLMTVEMVMHKGEDNPVVQEKASVKDALFVMTSKGLGAVSVINAEGSLIGLMTDGDVRRGLERGTDFLTVHLSDVMTQEPIVITSGRLAAEALHIMENHKPHPITVLPVVDENGRATGMVHITDLMKQGVV
ncbi:SIS domain-containing protein [Dialister hominis]|jgi:arabinose-5-phosphate isomerase|uniref:Arabinose-5-phosphate isomerase n=1 Tax=Dialister hominis TaxID=2582419 RepID=A0A8E4BSM1_9FIRM|nr:KpsF/GutQ family sugar-phosphate isomerase [Dialister hominis]UYJ16972.1 MAG: KpsF/GutQ family sugar-phosphate isomerase [Veillonellaceae bacterium]BBK24327.1 arabinose-5-phosphate isomerase [Dialister hominis]